MSTLNLRKRLVDIAKRDVGQTEISRNRSDTIKRYWPATNYPEGYANREPYCAAAVCYWVREWLKNPTVLAALGMTAAQAEKWRCKSARAFDWEDWGKEHGLLVYSDDPKFTVHTGDLMIFDISHIAVVEDDDTKKNNIFTVEANTSPTGSRDGEGNWNKIRPRSLAKCFVRIMD